MNSVRELWGNILGFIIQLLGGYTKSQMDHIRIEANTEAETLSRHLKDSEAVILEISNMIDAERDKRERAERDYRIEHDHAIKLMESEAEMRLQLERIPTAETVAEAAKAHSMELGHEIKRLTEENGRLQVELERANGGDALYSYAKGLQIQLHDVMAQSEPFGFPHSNPIPGSISVSIDDVDVGRSEIAVARSRAIVPDHITAAINEASDMGDKLSIMIQYMKSSGTFTRILEKLLKSGAMSLTLAYNPNCTNYELYTEMACRIYSGDAILAVELGDAQAPSDHDSSEILTTDELLKQL